MSAEAVIRVARGELGYSEAPAGSNETKYGKAYAWDCVPWCVIFLWWCFREAGEGEAFYGGKKTASCGTLCRWFAARGQAPEPEDIRPGDILILNFSGTGDTQHCGLVEQVVDREKGWYRTVEGNTSPGSEGSQWNGGCVALKVRNRKNVVGVCRPMYTEEMKEDHGEHWAEADIRWVLDRGLMKGYPDGSFQPDRPVTRAELAAVLRRAERLKEAETHGEIC